MQLFAIFLPSLFAMSGKSFFENPFDQLIWAQIGAQFLIAWPAWSIFKRRMNDMRPDIRAKLNNWLVGFPVYMTILLIVMVGSALGFDMVIDQSQHGTLRSGFFMMLFGAGFFAGGDAVPAAPGKSAREGRSMDLDTAGQRVLEQLPAAQIGRKPEMAVTRRQQAKPDLQPSFPAVIERGHKLPEQGRVKPGWFS
ncbi:MAG: hypothetical protein WCC66_04870 [Rhizobiaceae bacterium]